MKKAIIMGATSGLGREIALLLLKDGYRIGIAGRRAEALEDIRQQAPDMVIAKQIDVTDQGAPQLLEELINEMDGIDLYFHSSGYGSQNKDLDINIESRTLMTNGVGFVRMVDTVFNYFRRSGREGRIAAITSVAGTMGLGPSPSYSATKRMQWTYLEALSQLANSLKLKIHFTDIRPGFVNTDFLHHDKYPLLMEKEYAAQRIYSALRKGRRKVVVDWKYKLLCFAWRLIPQFIWERINLISR